MPRAARLVVPGCPHHVVERGNNRRQAERLGLAVQAHCLMTNHLHLIATPPAQDSPAKGVGRTKLYSTRYVNGLHGRSGHLRQDRFFSSALDEEWFWNALIYVERNAVRAKRVRKAWRSPWSSAAAHGGGRDRTGLPDLSAWGKLLAPGVDWRESLSRPQDEEVVQRVRSWSCRSCPVGSDGFLSKLERKHGRRLRPRPVARPPQRAAVSRK